MSVTVIPVTHEASDVYYENGNTRPGHRGRNTNVGNWNTFCMMRIEEEVGDEGGPGGEARQYSRTACHVCRGSS